MLVHVERQYIDTVWHIVAPMLKRALDLDPSFATIDQLQLLIRQGGTYLLVNVDDDEKITGAATVEFHDAPQARIAHVTAMGGSHLVRQQVFSDAQEWMRSMGATIAQCWTFGTLVQMYEKMGMTATHTVLRLPLTEPVEGKSHDD